AFVSCRRLAATDRGVVMRYVSPSFLVFALVMSLLPWVEVRCESVDAGPFGRYAVVTQNGWQAVLGEATGRVPTAQQLGAPDNRAQKELPKKIERDLEPAPLVGVFLGCALAAAILGFTVPGRKTRLIVT